MWYLQFHFVCDKLFTSFIMMTSLCFFVQLADRTLILSKGSFSVYIIATRLLLNHSPSEWFSYTKKRKPVGFLFGCRKPPGGVRGPQCSSQRSRCVGPWGLPGAPLLTGLPPRSSRHWRRSALPSGGFHRIWRHKVNCPEGTREGPLGGARQIRKKPCVARVSLHSSLAAP